MGKQISCKCLVCGHEQIGYDNRDGDTCNKCGGNLRRLGFIGVDFGSKKDFIGLINIPPIK